jgi:hypothetical protein
MDQKKTTNENQPKSNLHHIFQKDQAEHPMPQDKADAMKAFIANACTKKKEGASHE